jgi:hypothetical protein
MQVSFLFVEFFKNFVGRVAETKLGEFEKLFIDFSNIFDMFNVLQIFLKENEFAIRFFIIERQYWDAIIDLKTERV